MNNNLSQVSFLIKTRDFPKDAALLSGVLDRTYIDIANAVNNRVISIFAITKPTQTGETWYLDGNIRYQALRQVYTFTSTSDIPIGFKFSAISSFSRMSGTYTDGTSWYGLVPATSVAVAGVISFYLGVGSSTSDSIKFLVGAGAPSLTSGKIIIEWLSST
jgi:hypothetical protein